MKDYFEDKFLTLEAKSLFECDEFGNNNNIRYCHDCATFTHKDYDSVHQVTEFILHIGQDDADTAPYWQNEVENMRSYSCTDEFIEAYIQAKNLGAVRLMLWE